MINRFTVVRVGHLTEILNSGRYTSHVAFQVERIILIRQEGSNPKILSSMAIALSRCVPGQ